MVAAERAVPYFRTGRSRSGRARIDRPVAPTAVKVVTAAAEKRDIVTHLNSCFLNSRFDAVVVFGFLHRLVSLEKMKA
jgi:hypothetical protein